MTIEVVSRSLDIIYIIIDRENRIFSTDFSSFKRHRLNKRSDQSDFILWLYFFNDTRWESARKRIFEDEKKILFFLNYGNFKQFFRNSVRAHACHDRNETFRVRVFIEYVKKKKKWKNWQQK